MSYARILLTAVVMASNLCGCSRSARDLGLDPDLARSSLQQALNAWKDGKKPDELHPAITVGDAAWSAGKTLVSFEIQEQKQHSDGTNLYIPVQCTVRDSQGKVSKSETIYIIGTSPVITIFPQ